MGGWIIAFEFWSVFLFFDVLREVFCFLFKLIFWDSDLNRIFKIEHLFKAIFVYYSSNSISNYLFLNTFIFYSSTPEILFYFFGLEFFIFFLFSLIGISSFSGYGIFGICCGMFGI